MWLSEQVIASTMTRLNFKNEKHMADFQSKEKKYYY